MNFPPLTELLPHRPPFLLLRQVLTHGPTETVCETVFDPDFVRLFGGGDAAGGFTVPAAFALELIAQAMAVHDGLRRHGEAASQSPRRLAATRGLLLGSRRFELLVRTLPAGVPLRIVAGGDNDDGGNDGEASPAAASTGLVRFRGRVEDQAGTILAHGNVTVLETRSEFPG